MTNRLDSFETDLLDDLRRLVADRATTATDAPEQPRRRVFVTALAAGVAAVALLVAAPFVLSAPAYAVTTDPAAGIIHVKVNRLEDAAGLVTALAEHGVTADIAYLGYEMTCAPGRYRQEAAAAPDSASTFSIGGGIEITLDERDVAHGEVVVIDASYVRKDGVHAQVAIVNGPVAPCEEVPLTAQQLPQAQ